MTMTGLYQYFVTTVLLMGIAMLSTLVFYPRTQFDPSVGLHDAIDDRTYMHSPRSTNTSGSLYSVSQKTGPVFHLSITLANTVRF